MSRTNTRADAINRGADEGEREFKLFSDLRPVTSTVQPIASSRWFGSGALHGPCGVFAGADERVGAPKSELGREDSDLLDAVDAKEPDVVTEAIPR